jgi:hypothetical protein
MRTIKTYSKRAPFYNALIVQVEGAPAKLPSSPFLANFRFADYHGMIGEGYADLRDLRLG